jgi:hypothetical protein
MMRILTLKQPWASLIIGGHKDVENRTWATDYRGDLAIIAGFGIDRDVRALKLMREHLFIDDTRKLPRGCVIGIVEVFDMVTQSASPWFSGPVGWCVRDPRRTTLLQWRGSLGLGKLKPEQESAIRSAVLS